MYFPLKKEMKIQNNNKLFSWRPSNTDGHFSSPDDGSITETSDLIYQIYSV